MKKLLSIIIFSLFWNNTSLSENMFDYIGPPKELDGVCWYQAIYEKQKPCDRLDKLRETYNSMFFDLIKRPIYVSEQDFRNLISKRINEVLDSPEYKKKEKKRKKARKNEVDLNCSIIAGQANTWLAGRKIYKSCMKAEGY